MDCLQSDTSLTSTCGFSSKYLTKTEDSGGKIMFAQEGDPLKASGHGGSFSK